MKKFIHFIIIKFIVVIFIIIIVSIRGLILGLRPTVKLGSDATLSGPQFESPSALVFELGSCTNMHRNNRIGTQI